MRLLFDLIATQPNKTKNHGGSEYAKVVFKELLYRKGTEKITGVYNSSKELPLFIQELSVKHDVELIKVRNNNEIARLVKRNKYDRFYSALPYGYHDVDLSGVMNIFTIHGLREIEISSDKYEYMYSRNIKELAKTCYKNILPGRYIKMKRDQIHKIINKCRNGKIIVPSLHTKYSLIANFPFLSNSKIHVSYSPLKEIDQINLKTNISIKSGLQIKKYFLIISADRWIKNSYRALQALDQIISEYVYNDFEVVVVGIDNSHRIANSIKNKKRFSFKGYIDEDELMTYYKHAFAFIYPSLNEGFGYPPLEAMSFGTPVIGSPLSAVYEICRDSILYFNPYCIDEIKNRVLTFINEEDIRNEYSQKGLYRYTEIRRLQTQSLDRFCEVVLK